MAERHRPDTHDPAAQNGLDERGQELQRVLEDAFKNFQPQVSACLDIPQITVRPKEVVHVCRVAKEDPRLVFKMLLCLAGVDYQGYIQVVYVLLSLEHEQKMVIKTDVPYENLHLPSVTSVWRGADWYEREAHDLFGVVFDGHPNLTPLILYEGFEGYPGRREHPFHDYQEF